MSAPGSIRTRAEQDRGPAVALSSRSRVQNSRSGANERPLSSGELIPEDSASNAPTRRSNSGSYRPNGYSKTIFESQKERIQQTTREKIQMKTKSPTKPSTDQGQGNHASQSIPSRQDIQSSPKQSRMQEKEKSLRTPPVPIYLPHNGLREW